MTKPAKVLELMASRAARREPASSTHGRSRLGQAGFSLMEVMVSLGILAILAYTALPSGAELFKKHALGSALEQVAFEVARARMQAVGQNKFVRIRFTEADTYVIETSRNGYTFTTVETQELPTGVSVTSAQNPTFNRRGLANSTSTITLSDGSIYKNIFVNRLGNAKVS